MDEAPPQPMVRAPARNVRVALYAATIFSSAFLLFQIQPLVGRIVLPLFGGAASVWTACMLFFQALLLLGYLYAHWSASLLAAPLARRLHMILLAASIAALVLGLTAAPAGPPAGDPTLGVLRILLVLVGLPYLTLSTTGPLLQAWFSAEIGRPPYRLFALSNLGSMLALLSYPLIVEPRFAVTTQTRMWSLGFALFCGLTALLAFPLRHADAAAKSTAGQPSLARPDATTRLIWTLLAFCPSVLLLAITRHVTDDLAPIPLLWIAFLSIYLLSFILCFESERWYRRALFIPATLAMLTLVSIALARGLPLSGRGFIALHAITLFCASMTCHGELAARKPPAQLLTSYYLWVAVGGVLGGVCVGLVAPHLFTDYHELPIGIVLTLSVIAVLMPRRDLPGHPRVASVRSRAAMLLLTLAVAAGLAHHAVKTDAEARLMRRNFYGRLVVKDVERQGSRQRILYHGGTIHGMEPLDGHHPLQATTYYTESSGVGRAILATRRAGAQRVGVIGLGAGTMSAYARPGDVYRFYDINPQVVRIARTWFHFLGESAGKVELVLGDGRLALQSDHLPPFDVLVVDAFSGDSIPVHLLTREALQLYFSRLAPDGILAVHVSNRYLDLQPVLAAHAQAMAKAASVFDTDDSARSRQYGSTWVLLANSAVTLGARELKGGTLPRNERTVRQWTDDYSSIAPLLK